MSERVINNNFKSVSSLSFTQVTLSDNLITDFFIIKNKMDKEIWKDVKGFEGFYQVSNFCNVKSLFRKVKGRYNNLRIDKERILRPSIKANGYFGVTFAINKTNKYFSLHRLVAIAFIPNPLNLPEVNHKDGNKLNNNIENLEWVSKSENGKHAYSIGCQKRLYGENARNNKLTELRVKQIRSLNETGKYTLKQIASIINENYGTVYSAATYKTWRFLK